MRHSAALLIVWLGLAGCNLFTATEVPGDPTSDVAQQDGDTPDFGPLPDGCLPESDAELCAAAGATCGTLALGDGTPQEFQAEDVAADDCGASGDFVRFCNSTTTATANVEVDVAADYRLSIIARAEVFGEVPAIAELSVDGMVVGEIPVFDAEAAEYGAVVTLGAGAHEIRWRFANDAVLDGEDRNLDVDLLRVQGIGQVRDRCGQPRSPNCGACGSGSCGLQRPNACGCACPLEGGACADMGPHPTLQCLECGPSGWFGLGGTCGPGDGCATGQCDERAGVCVMGAVECPTNVTCEAGTCVAGACQYATAPDGTACGTGGICTAGACACPDGTGVETNCAFNDGDDDDCDGLRNCADPDCDGRGCGGNRSCQGGVCQ